MIMMKTLMMITIIIIITIIIVMVITIIIYYNNRRYNDVLNIHPREERVKTGTSIASPTRQPASSLV